MPTTMNDSTVGLATWCVQMFHCSLYCFAGFLIRHCSRWRQFKTLNLDQTCSISSGSNGAHVADFIYFLWGYI